MTERPRPARRRAATVSAVLAAAAPLLPGAAAAFITSNGVRIETPPVSEMSCSALKAKLEQIDESGYRGAHPAPPDPRDMPLFEYENEVSVALYGQCPTAELGPAQRSEVFRKGFQE